jgi:putative redox protein
VTRERRAELRHVAGMRFVATTGTGRTIEFGDQAEANEQSPVELVTAAIAACTGMDVVSILAKKRQVVEEYTVHVAAVQRDEYPQVLTRIDIVHEVAGPRLEVTAVRRAIELSATKYCPVNAMLSAGDTEVHHRFRVRATGPKPTDSDGEVVITGPFRQPEVMA